MGKFAVQPVRKPFLCHIAGVAVNDSIFDECCWTRTGVVLPRS